jgi:hypothetical protein
MGDKNGGILLGKGKEHAVCGGILFTGLKILILNSR